MPLTAFNWKSGVVKDDTPLAAEGGYIDADKVRFSRGKPQSIGGWDAAVSSTFEGIARGGHSWSDNGGRRWLAWGTAAKLYAFAGGTLLDITPIHSSGVLFNALTTTAGSPVVRVTHPDHALATGQSITFANQAMLVGGNVALDGAYTVTVTDRNTYTVTDDTSATTSATGGGGPIDYTVPFAAGLVDGLGEPGGYGSGAYSEGGYGGTVTSAATLPRTWSLDNWGENLLAVPRGGGLYEFQPANSYPELVGNGDFSTALGWTTGSGWSIGAGVATGAVTAGANDLSRAITMPAGKMLRVTVTIPSLTPGSTTLVANSIGTTLNSNVVLVNTPAHGMAVNDVFTLAGGTAVAGVTINGTWLVATVTDVDHITFVAATAATGTVSGGGTPTISSPKLTVKTDTGPLIGPIQTSGTYTRYIRTPLDSTRLIITKNRHWAGTLDNVSVMLAPTAYRVAEAPPQNDYMFVDPHQLVVMLGTVLPGDAYNPMAVRWSDIRDLTNWSPTPSNFAGYEVLSAGGKLVSGLATRQQNTIWTDTALYTMQFTGDPATVFNTQFISAGCGIVGPMAADEQNGAVFWASRDSFFMFQGSAPQPIPCPLRRDFFDHLADGQEDKISAGVNSGFGEIWWLYPDSRDGAECSRYVAYNYEENHWTCGTFNRSTFVASGVFPYPIMLGTDGIVYYHEYGHSASGGVLEGFVEAAYVDLDDGQNLMHVRRLVPDFEDQVGPVHIEIGMRLWPNAIETIKGPFTATNSTEKIDLRATARQMKPKISFSSSPAFFRLGAIRADVMKSGALR